MKSTTLSAGATIDARCTKCREITNHTIIAMVDDQPAMVMCNTCQGRHKYRAPKAEKPATTTPSQKKAPAKKRLTAEQRDQQQWQDLNLDSCSNVKIYAIDVPLKVKDIVRHPTFGLGQVTGKTGQDKATVLFEGGSKILRCAKA
ncbi:hypothetical protein [Desulfuromonas acetoxidans]|uniref:Uncharacterized protein n=1 Tax=Desulfuromonas acetoxidans (strain DSM 684 / 11070) TaxID=281689 RepID=Q1JWM5_DESA6|nr:hypothetical protein [Desulfuromonas acetoxidans]EAT14654.1 conserved hypothetical protein [Desulfuromonas acetoxidans DSM 684]MBF0645054.1 hypothetical protein [Desulfuromonas acetoxidans]NVD23136.1 hypothetical protein [Desulfuromonas acetoxidans]NVE15623.1 hypothetical protein [Desulfuromonas acetoxidans]